MGGVSPPISEARFSASLLVFLRVPSGVNMGLKVLEPLNFSGDFRGKILERNGVIVETNM